MIIIRLKGGMGNQMFQYAFGRKLARELNTSLQLDLSSLLDRSKGEFVYRDYDLSIFNVEANFLMKPNFLRMIYRPKISLITRVIRSHINKGRVLVKEKDFHFQASMIRDAKVNNIYEGWFQSPLYFKEIESVLKEAFSFKKSILPISQDLLKRINTSNAICLNVRRTDFLKVDTLNTTNKNYFLKAANYMAEQIENPVFFIFSDDIEWCRENIVIDFPLEIVEHEHKGEKFGNYLQLMIACKHYIIPNSSFAWWAVWLNENKNKKVIAPKKWFNDASINTNDLTVKDWVRI